MSAWRGDIAKCLWPLGVSLERRLAATLCRHYGLLSIFHTLMTVFHSSVGGGRGWVSPLHRAYSWASLTSLKLTAKLRKSGLLTAAETLAFLALILPLVDLGTTHSSSLFWALKKRLVCFPCGDSCPSPSIDHVEDGTG